MKVLFAPLNYGSVQQTGIYDAFRQAGCQLEIFDYFYEHEQCKRPLHVVRQGFIDRCIDFAPELIFLQIQHTGIIDANSVGVVKSKLPGAVIVNWSGDVRNYVPNPFLTVGSHAHHNLISSVGQLEMFRAAKVQNVGYLQIGYDPQKHFPDTSPKSSFQWDVSFVGNVNSREKYPGHIQRLNTAYALRQAFGNRFGLFGHGWPRDLTPQHSVTQGTVCQEVYHNSRVVISVSHYNELNHYFSDRLLMCMASGRPTVSWEFPGWESYFTNRCDLMMAKDQNDIVAKVRALLDNSELANYIGECGAEKVFAEHTYLSRIKELFEIIRK